MNTITIELCKEDRARLDAILEALRGGQTAAAEAATPAVATQDDAERVTPTNETPEEEKPAETATEAVEEAKAEPAPTVTKEMVQTKVVQLVQAGKKPEARGIVQAYAPNVSGIPEDKLTEVWEKLTALEG